MGDRGHNRHGPKKEQGQRSLRTHWRPSDPFSSYASTLTADCRLTPRNLLHASLPSPGGGVRAPAMDELPVISRLATIDMDRSERTQICLRPQTAKVGGGAVPFSWGQVEPPSNANSPVPRPITSVPSSILIHHSSNRLVTIHQR